MAAFEACMTSLSYTCSECCWRTSTEKNTCGIARFPCGSTAFLLFYIMGQYTTFIYFLDNSVNSQPNTLMPVKLLSDDDEIISLI